MNKKRIVIISFLVLVVFSFLFTQLKEEMGSDFVERELSYLIGNDKIYGKIYIPKDGIEKHKTIIMAHGFTGDSDMYNNYAEYFVKKGYVCYTFDFRGGNFRGRSSMNFKDMSILTEKMDLETVIDKLQEEVFVDKNNMFFLGESMGSLVAAVTLPKYNNVIKASIFLYPAFNMKEMISKTSRGYEVLGIPVGEKFVNDLENIDAYLSIKEYNNDILIIHGSIDELVPISVSQRLEKENGNIILEVLNGENHGFSDFGDVKAMDLSFKFFEKYN